jgi:hypothetical protein
VSQHYGLLVLRRRYPKYLHRPHSSKDPDRLFASIRASRIGDSPDPRTAARRRSKKLSPTARRGGGGFTARLLEKASKIVPPIAVDGFIFHAPVSQYHRYMGNRGNEVKWSHDEWGNTPSSMPSLHEVERSHDEWGTTPSSMPSLLPCEAAAYNATTGTSITTVVGPPCDADDPIDIVHHRILSLDTANAVDGRYRCLAPTQFNLLSGGARCPRLPTI